MMLTEGIRIPFRFATGAVTSRFLQALADDAVILGSRCGECSRVACPARSCCPWCCADVSELEPVGPAGVLVAMTRTSNRGAYALVRLDGADGALVHRLIGDELARGTRVVATFAEERHGSITDIDGFVAEERGTA